jgi:hypothetical protein
MEEQAEEQPRQAVRVPERPAAALERGEEGAEQELERVAGAEMQAGEEASHPV